MTRTHRTITARAMSALALAAAIGLAAAGCAVVDQACRDLKITNKIFHDGTVGELYLAQVTVESSCQWWMLEGDNFMEYGVYSGALPPGVDLDPMGAFYGIPTQAGTFNFEVSARHLLRVIEVRKNFAITILPPQASPGV